MSSKNIKGSFRSLFQISMRRFSSLNENENLKTYLCIFTPRLIIIHSINVTVRQITEKLNLYCENNDEILDSFIII